MRINLKNVLATFGVLLILYCLYYFSDIVGYILSAWVLSLLGKPLMGKLRRWLSFKRFVPGNALLSLLTMLFFLVSIGLVVWLFVPLVIEQANNLSHVDIEALNNTLHEPIENLKNSLYQYGLIDHSVDLNEQVFNSVKKLIEPKKIGSFFSGLIGMAGNALITVTSVMFILFFFLKEEKSFDNFLRSSLPIRYEAHINHVLATISNLLRRYFIGILTQVTILTTLIYASLSILGIKNALLIAFFGALMNVIPYLGIIIAMAFGVMITISSHIDQSFSIVILPMVIKVLATFGTMQLLDNFLVQPYVYSNSVNAHPLEIFLIIMVAAKISGVLGMLIAVPTYTCLKVILKAFFKEWRIVQTMTAGIDGTPDRGG